MSRKLLILLAVFISLVPALAPAQPVTLEETAFQLTLLKGGRAEVLYSITFTEHEGRDRIRSIGQFLEPMTVLESWGESGDEKFGVTMENNGSGYYAALFDIQRDLHSQYPVQTRYPRGNRYRL